jgi:hypothetical protein
MLKMLDEGLKNRFLPRSFQPMSQAKETICDKQCKVEIHIGVVAFLLFCLMAETEEEP